MWHDPRVKRCKPPAVLLHYTNNGASGRIRLLYNSWQNCAFRTSRTNPSWPMLYLSRA